MNDRLLCGTGLLLIRLHSVVSIELGKHVQAIWGTSDHSGDETFSQHHQTTLIEAALAQGISRRGPAWHKKE